MSPSTTTSKVSLWRPGLAEVPVVFVGFVEEVQAVEAFDPADFDADMELFGVGGGVAVVGVLELVGGDDVAFGDHGPVGGVAVYAGYLVGGELEDGEGDVGAAEGAGGGGGEGGEAGGEEEEGAGELAGVHGEPRLVLALGRDGIIAEFGGNCAGEAAGGEKPSRSAWLGEGFLCVSRCAGGLFCRVRRQSG